MRMERQQDQNASANIVTALADEVVNLRDFGGQSTVDGRRVKTGMLYRSGHLATLSDSGCALLDAQGFALVADLRFAKEREEAPSLWPTQAGIDILRVEGGEQSEGPHVAVLKSGALAPDDIDHFYRNFYRTIPFDPHFRPMFAAIIARIANASGPALIHCSVGKDRTGILVALIHHLLDVTPEAIRANYMKTREAPGLEKMVPEIIDRLRDRLQQDITPATARKMLGVEESYLDAAFDEIVQQCGSIAEYLAQSGVDDAVRDSLRARLLS